MITVPEHLQLIGISGTFSSGKDTIAEYLVRDFGYTHVSTSDLVREAAMREYGSIERPILHRTADEHRKKNGPGIFVEMGLDKPRPLVFTGIRSLGEANTIKKHGGIMVYVDAPIEVRYERVKSRQRDGESGVSLEEFRAREDKEMYSGPTDADFNIRGIGEMADVTLINTGLSLEEYIALAYRAIGLKK
jgi:dephospho-CoA kinase